VCARGKWGTSEGRRFLCSRGFVTESSESARQADSHDASGGGTGNGRVGPGGAGRAGGRARGVGGEAAGWLCSLDGAGGVGGGAGLARCPGKGDDGGGRGRGLGERARGCWLGGRRGGHHVGTRTYVRRGRQGGRKRGRGWEAWGRGGAGVKARVGEGHRTSWRKVGHRGSGAYWGEQNGE
jgi:hypothetical protein